ncbi:MAG: 2-oxoacid:acceptor oxidoreductase subunit alpha [Elusimicrobia bacterium HGW-Elusimicrobia-3]|nr:MAG: 2-oxoacid:acceptor oxidoreductase subunit alpha [Elusimicrobia bacterium HGW-Elusimicrobia-3]
MSLEINVRISGEAGQGVVSAGMMLCRMYKDSGRHIFAIQDYMSRIRGGTNFFQVRAAAVPVHSPREKCDLIVALDKDAVAANQAELAPGGLMVLDKQKYGIVELRERWVDVPLYALAQEAGGTIYANSVALGAVAALTGESFDDAAKAARREFSAKGGETAEKNAAAARKGYDYVSGHIKERLARVDAVPHGCDCLLAGSETLALGAISAGCKFYTAYPMSPSTGVMNTVADYAARFGIIVEQAEDEIAAVNMAVGAAYAGVRSMTASSGGGFALMCEGVSLAAMTETPLVLAVVMRPGPATGFPTRTAQEDLEFVLHAGHGEFARAVYTPGSPEECFLAAKRAFNTAERWQVPALIMSDQHLAESFTNIAFPDQAAEPPDRGRLLRSGADAPADRYAYAADGVSPRPVPGRPGPLAAADSDEHGPEGHITELAEVRVKMTGKRLHLKLAGLAKEALTPTIVNPGAKTMLCGFGSTLGVLRDACAAVRDAGFVHFPQVWPLPAQAALAGLQGAVRVLTVENNATGQLARLLRRETGLEVTGSVLKYDGRPFTVDEVTAALERGD